METLRECEPQYNRIKGEFQAYIQHIVDIIYKSVTALLALAKI